MGAKILKMPIFYFFRFLTDKWNKIISGIKKGNVVWTIAKGRTLQKCNFMYKNTV